MSVIYVKDKKWDVKDLAAQQNCTIDEWMAAFCPVKKCTICGENLWERNFIFWRGDTDIAFCESCAEHALAGLNRDLCELKGKIKRIKVGYFGKGNPLYNAAGLKERVDELTNQNIRLTKQVLDLQNALMKKDN